MLNTPFPTWPSFSEEEANAARDVLLSGRVNYWTGDEGRNFEREFASFAGTSHAVALANGTLALEAAWAALGIGPGDEVITTPRSFVASASTIAMSGARPVFADVDPDSQNITPETTLPHVTPRTKAILCVHLAGWPCDMAGFEALAADRGIALVEDCAQAHGARIGDRAVGSFGTVAAWSFCQDKILTTAGEGGMVTLSDDHLWQRIWSMKDHGKSYDAVYGREHKPGFRWLTESWGSNWRMTEIQAAIGRLQLRRLPAWHTRRREHALAIAAALAECGIFRIPLPGAGIEHAWYKFHIFVKPEAVADGWDRDRIVAEINARGVPAFTGICPEIYREKVFDDAGLAPERPLPVAARLGETSIMLLVHPTLRETDIRRTCDVLSEVAGLAAR